MKFIYIILLPLTLIIPTVLMFMTNRNYQKEVIKKCSYIYGLEASTLRIKYELMNKKNLFINYPLIENEIQDLLVLEKDNYIEIKKLKMSRYKLLDISPIVNFVKLVDEIKACDNKDIINLFCESNAIINKITKIKFPYRMRINKLIHKIQEFILYCIILVLVNYKTLTRKDIVDAEKEEYKDGHIKTNLKYY